MAQFDVFRNPGRQRATMPFLVSLQNARFDRSATRCVAPLVLRDQVGVREHYVAPGFVIAGPDVVMDVFNLATVPTDRLGPPVASLADDASRTRLTGALDELVSRA